MNKANTILQRVTYTLIIAAILFYTLTSARAIIAPLLFAALLTLILAPLCGWFEDKLNKPVLASVLAIAAAVIPFGIILFIFSWFSIDIFSDLPSINKELNKGMAQLLDLVNQYTGTSNFDSQKWIEDNVGKLASNSLNFISEGVSFTTTTIANVFITLLYTFFLLLYRRTYKSFLIIQFNRTDQDKMRESLNGMQKVLQQYCYGMLSVIILLAVLNTIGLYLIGINYAPFWGIMAAFLVIIPYIGTTLGGFLPFVYALATTGTLWQPAAVVAYYFFIQQIEGNFITPKIVGSNISLNPLVVIVGMFIGGSMWGISGLIVALPLLAMIKVLFDEIDELKPVGVLMDDEIRSKDQELEDDYNQNRYRLFR